MHALLAVFAFTPIRPFPAPFLSTQLEPIFPIEILRGVTRRSVSRAGSWRPGGLVRLTFNYVYPKGKAPTIAEFLSEPGFTDETPPLQQRIKDRVWRERDGVRQIVLIRTLNDGEVWPWAKVKGPATVVSVTDVPSEEPPPRVWHKVPELINPTFPPSFPHPLDFLVNCPITAVDSDPIIPRFFRSMYWIAVRVGSEEARATVSQKVRKVLSSRSWKESSNGSADHFSVVPEDFGLSSVEVTSRTFPRNPKLKTEICITYRFQDFENSPRIRD